MPSYQRVEVIGHLGRDPELRNTTSGKQVCNFSVAATEKWKGGEHTEWFRCVAWDRTGEIIAKYVSSGNPIFVAGSMRTRSFTGKDGTTQYRTELIVREVQLLGGKPGQGQAPAPQPQTRAAPPARQPAPSVSDFDDDIPF